MKTVKGVGPQPAKIMIIGEAPGAEEEAQGKPFVGSAGKLLSVALREAGINRDECYITNVVKVKPPDNDLKRLEELGCKIEQFLPELRQEVLATNPNIIILLGAVPLKHLGGKNSILKWRGSVIQNTTLCGTITKTLPTIHPAACLRQWSYFPLLVFDLKKAKKESEFSELRRVEREYKINPTFEEVLQEIERLKNEAEYISEDIETYKGSGIIRCVGLADKVDRGISIPFVDAYTPIWTLEEEVEIWGRLQELLIGNTQKKIVVQNAKFEQKMLEPWLDGVLPVWMDTMRAHALVYPELPHNLGFLGSVYTDMAYWKDTEDGDGKASDASVPFDALQEYNCKDVCGTLEIALKLEQELKEYEMHSFYHQYDKPLSVALKGMEQRGIPVSKQRVEELRTERLNKLQELEKSFQELAGEVNVRSPKQMQKFLYEDLALPVRYNKKTGKPTTSEDAILKLLRKSNNEALGKIIEIRSLKHDLSSFLFLKNDKKKGYIDELPIQIGEDSRLHTEYGITETGRLSSSADIFGRGTNLQNVPGYIRIIFEAPQGKVFVKMDLAQAEDRVTAWLANEVTLKRLYTEGVDTHIYKAAMALNKKLEDITKEERKAIKSVAHGWNYGRGAKSIAEEIGLSKKEVESFIHKLNQAFPAIGAWHLGIQQQLKQNRTLITPFGRKRTFMGRWGDDLFREAYAFGPQSTVADYTNKALLRMCALYHNVQYQDGVVDRWKNTQVYCNTLERVEILHQCHDEILSLVDDGVVGDFIVILKAVVEQPVWCDSGMLTIPAEIKVGKNWGECKKMG